jgi:hypothetical protein
MSSVQVLPLEAVMPGALLAEPVLDTQGQVLIPSGIMVEEHHLAALARRGIPSLSIQIDPDAEALEQQREDVRNRVRYLFRHTTTHPGAQALLHATLAFRLEHLQ